MARKRAAPKPEKKTRRKSNGEHKAAPQSVAGTTAGSNASVRAGIMRTAFREMYEIENEIAAEKAKHVTPLQEQLRERKKALRNDLDAKAADLNFGYAAYKRDRQLAEMADGEDGEAAKASQDMMREVWETLAEGQTLNFLDAIERQSGDKFDGSPNPGYPNTETARAAGYDAGREGKNAFANPYAEKSDEGIAWEEGRGRGMLANAPGQSEGVTAH